MPQGLTPSSILVGLDSVDLQAGGVLTQKVVGGVDRVEVPTFGTDYAYYDNYQLINDSHPFAWDSEQSLQRFVTGFVDGSVTDQLAIAAPDEFKFSFMGYSGSFYLNHEGEWKIKTKQNIAIKIEEDAPSSFDLCMPGAPEACITLRRILQKFTLTPGIIKYTFGGTDSSIEFTRYFEYNANDYLSNVTAKSWYLAKIETPNRKRMTWIINVGVGKLSELLSLSSQVLLMVSS